MIPTRQRRTWIFHPEFSLQRAGEDGRWKIVADGKRRERHGSHLLTTEHRPPTSDDRPPNSAHRPPTPAFRSPSSVRGLPVQSKIKNPKSNIFSSHLRSPISDLREKASAFSLVELLVVVGIVAMLSVAAVPVMRGLGGAQSSRATAQILVSALEQARTAAILSGTNAYLVLPDANFPATNYRFSSYAIIRPKVTNNGGTNDDFFPSNPSSWILISKWERLPGNLIFSANKLSALTNLAVTNLSLPQNPGWSGDLRAVGFAPGGGLTDDAGTNGLLFAPSNKVIAGKAAVADRIEISLYSGRVRYAGLTNNADF